MSGPNSSPDGDRSLVTGYCDEQHVFDCCKNKWYPSKREHERAHNRLRTGKTRR